MSSQDRMIVDGVAPAANQQVGNPDTVPIARDLAAERDAERKADAAAAKAKETDRFTVKKFSSTPKVFAPSAPEYESIILKSAANFVFQDLTYPTVSTYVPNFSAFFYILHYMDILMCNTRKWTENCSGWAPPYSQMFFTVLLYYQVFVAMDAAGIAPPDIVIFIQTFERTFPLADLWIPGPLVAAFRALAAFRPDANDLFAGVTPNLPAAPGFIAADYRMANTLPHLVPNLSCFISRLRAICAVSQTANIDENTFQASMDGPSVVQHLFGTQVANNAQYQNHLLSPGMAFRYSGSLRLWQNAAQMLALNSVPADLVQAAPTVINDTWTSAMRLENGEHVWLAPVAATMAKYSQFWNGSVPLSEIRPTSSAAGAVKLRQGANSNIYTVPTFVANVPAAPPAPAVPAHFNLRSSARLLLDGQIALRDIPDAHIMSAITFAFNMYYDNPSQTANRLGRFWNLGPDVKSNTAIEVLPGTLQCIAREYHRDTRLEAHKQ